MKLAVLVAAMALAHASSVYARGIITSCTGTSGKTSYELKIFASPGTQGGFRLTENYSGSFPATTTELGTTNVTKDGPVLEVELATKAYEGIGGIPQFVTESGSPGKVIIDATDPQRITASYLGAALECK